jgi:hypothetical protein
MIAKSRPVSTTSRQLHYTYAEYLAIEVRQGRSGALESVGARLEVDELYGGLEDAPGG